MSQDWLVAFRSHDAGGVQYVNTFCMHTEPGPGSGDPDAEEAANAAFDWCKTEYLACLSAGYTCDDVVARSFTSPEVHIKAINAAGTVAFSTANLPKECVAVMSLTTAHATRSGRGNIRIPSPRDAVFVADNTNWKTSASSYWGGILAFGAKLLGGHDFSYGSGGTDDAHASLRVYSRKDAVSRDVTNIQYRSQIRWLRSRSTAP